LKKIKRISDPENSSEYPFVFIYNGKPLDIYSFQGEKYLVVFFKNNLSDNDAKKIEKLIPKPLSGSFLWTENMLMNYNISDEDEIIMYYMKKNKTGYDVEMDDKLMMKLFTDFANDIEQWAIRINEISPVLYFIGNNRINGSKWDKFSTGRISEILDYIDTNTGNITPRKKQIFNETIAQLKEGKFHDLSGEQKSRMEKLLKLLT